MNDEGAAKFVPPLPLLTKEGETMNVDTR